MTQTHPGSALLRGKLLDLKLVVPLDLKRADNLVALDVLDLRHHADLVEGASGELAGVALDVSVVDMCETRERVRLGVGGVDILEEVHVVGHECRGHAVLEHDDVRVVDGPVRVLVDMEGREGHARDIAGRAVRRREGLGRRQRDGEEGDNE